MKINQAEELVGITKKNIRFYEDQGLLNPSRNPENGYRDYSDDDIRTLLQIKLLRTLSVPVEEIRRLQLGSMSFSSCMENQQLRLVHEQRRAEQTAELCAALAAEVSSLDMLDASAYLEKIRQMEKGGTEFMDIKNTDVKKKKTGSMLSAAAMIIFFAAMIVLLAWAQSEDPIPLPVIGVLIVMFAAPIIGVIIALKQRIKEINGGEEDEARKY